MCEHIFVFLKYMPRSRIIGLQGMHKYDFSFFSQKLPNCFQKWLYCFTFPPKVYEVSSFSTPLACVIISL